MRAFWIRWVVGVIVSVVVLPWGAEAQSLEVEPAEPAIQVGESVTFQAYFVTADGRRMADSTVVFYSRARRQLPVSRDGSAQAKAAGTFEVLALRPADGDVPRLVARIPVTVAQPPITGVAVQDAPARMYAGTQIDLGIAAVDAAGHMRPDVEVAVETSDPAVASVDAAHTLTASAPGSVTLTATARGNRTTHSLTVVENPVVTLELTGGAEQARTGDVLDFDATARDADDRPVDDAPVSFALQAFPDDDLGPGATGQIDTDGRFVAEAPGRYVIKATSGSLVARRVVDVIGRNVQRDVELVGQGRVSDVHTSDLWVWEAADGRDYAVTGTWGGNGEAYFWDVTDPADLIPVDTVTVDARTVNDVKVSADGQTCILSREGASDRKNGIVILDCSDPTDVSIITEYTENLTGGVHNLFIYEDHVYALSNGRRYDIINIEDRANPRRVGSFELDTPGHSIHDVWVEDGIAYSSNWSDGVVMVDVGNGIKGGSPSNPVEITRYAYPNGWNHAAFPYHDTETGTSYIIAGDEAFPNGLSVDDRPTIPAGWIHFIDVTDVDNPKEVARYQVPEAGTHNFWVKGDTLYIAYYNAGLRVVDISGDLKGDLYDQGREIAKYLPFDPDGRIPNAPMTWGPQPHKGHIFFSDWNSGLWTVKLQAPEEEPAQ